MLFGGMLSAGYACGQQTIQHCKCSLTPMPRGFLKGSVPYFTCLMGFWKHRIDLNRKKALQRSTPVNSTFVNLRLTRVT